MSLLLHNMGEFVGKKGLSHRRYVGSGTVVIDMTVMSSKQDAMGLRYAIAQFDRMSRVQAIAGLLIHLPRTVLLGFGAGRRPDDPVLHLVGVKPYPEEMAGFQRSDVSRAVAAGLTIRPIAETAADTLRWAREADPDPGPAMTREREAALLREWSLI